MRGSSIFSVRNEPGGSSPPACAAIQRPAGRRSVRGRAALLRGLSDVLSVRDLRRSRRTGLIVSAGDTAI